MSGLVFDPRDFYLPAEIEFYVRRPIEFYLDRPLMDAVDFYARPIGLAAKNITCPHDLQPTGATAIAAMSPTITAPLASVVGSCA